MQYGCGRMNLQYGCSTDTGVHIYSTGVVRIGAYIFTVGAYKFKLRAYIPATRDVLINIHVRTYGCSTLTFFCHVPYVVVCLHRVGRIGVVHHLWPLILVFKDLPVSSV